MKINPKLKQDIEKYKEYVIVVEGKKDVSSLKALGFEKVFPIHQTSVPLRQAVEEIASQTDKKDKICILTDFDRRGKKLYMDVKQIFQELGARLDSSLRGLIIKAQISHIEGLHKFLQKVEDF